MMCTKLQINFAVSPCYTFKLKCMHKTRGYWLILVDCASLLQLMPDFQAAARDLKDEGIALGSVNGDLERELFKEFGITGYPTLIVSALRGTSFMV